MSERIFSSNVDASVTFPNWGAIWAGAFAFIAIWSVFGLLGEAIFASIANPNAAYPIMAMSVGIGFWTVILTVLAMFVGGLTTGRLAGVNRTSDAIVYGMVMFGLSIAAALAVSALGAFGFGTFMITSGVVHSVHALSVFATFGWIGFVALFLGWLAAVGGASSAIQHSTAATTTEQARRAAA